MRSSYIGRKTHWVPIEKCETEILVEEGLQSLSIKCTQFHLTLAWEFTVIDFDLQKQESFGPEQILYCIGEFKKSVIKVNKDALLEYERLKQNDLHPKIKRKNTSEDTVTVLVHNVRSFSRHADDIVSDNRITNNDIIGFTETQISPSDSTWKIIETWNVFNINFNKNKNKFLSLAYWCRNDVVLLDKFDANGVPILSFQKHAFADRALTLMLCYRNQFMRMRRYV